MEKRLLKDIYDFEEFCYEFSTFPSFDEMYPEDYPCFVVWENEPIVSEEIPFVFITVKDFFG